jgi:hypothetical protein
MTTHLLYREFLLNEFGYKISRHCRPSIGFRYLRSFSSLFDNAKFRCVLFLGSMEVDGHVDNGSSYERCEPRAWLTEEAEVWELHTSVDRGIVIRDGELYKGHALQ